MGSYLLALSDEERARYRFMAANARRVESERWHAAGIVEGASVADIGCGPGAILAALARVVGPSGRVHGVDADRQAVAYAREEVSSFPQASAREGSALASGLEPGAYDVAVCRHVLAHNSEHELAIVEQLSSLVRPGGAVYLVDSVAAGMAMWPEVPELVELAHRYVELQGRTGNDLRAGMRLGALLGWAGLEVEHFACESPVFQAPVGVRPPAWAARDQLVRAGLATAEEVEAWGRAFDRVDAMADRPWYFAATFVAIGRRADPVIQL